MKFAYLIEPPFNDIASDGSVTGCDVELARLALAAAGVESVELVEAGFADLLPGLKCGRWQMTTGLFITEARRQEAVFSTPIWTLRDGLLTAHGNPHGIAGLESFCGGGERLLAVIKGQVQHETALAAGVPPARIVCFATYREAADAVADGKVAGYLSVSQAHHGHVARSPDARFCVMELRREQGAPASGAFGFARKDTELCAAVNRFLRTFLGSGAHAMLLKSFGMESAMP